jgi:hypothetical protein
MVDFNDLVAYVDNPVRFAKVVGRLIETDVNSVEVLVNSRDMRGTRASDILGRLILPLKFQVARMQRINSGHQPATRDNILPALTEREVYLPKVRDYMRLLEVGEFREFEMRQEAVTFPHLSGDIYIAGVLGYVAHYSKIHLGKREREAPR